MIDTPYQVRTRLVVAGDHFELYNFDQPFWVGFPRLQPKKKLVKITVLRPQEEMRADNVRRTRKQIRRLVNANSDMTKFVTLTYAANKGDISAAYCDFDRFLKRLKRFVGENVKFLAVTEYQKRGAVHFHLLANLPYVAQEQLAALWGHGFVKINVVDHVSNLGAYISKYLGKGNFDGRFFGKKKFTRSQNLKQPLVVDNLEAEEYLEFFMSKDLHLTYEAEFDTRWLGGVKYKYYQLYAEFNSDIIKTLWKT